MKLLNWLKSKYQHGAIQGLVSNCASAPSVERDTIGLFESNQPLRITVFRAVGGLVIQTSFYDHNSDNTVNSLHIVNNSDSLGDCLGKIITVEVLKMPRT